MIDPDTKDELAKKEDPDSFSANRKVIARLLERYAQYFRYLAEESDEPLDSPTNRAYLNAVTILSDDAESFLRVREFVHLYANIRKELVKRAQAENTKDAKYFTLQATRPNKQVCNRCRRVGRPKHPPGQPGQLGNTPGRPTTGSPRIVLGRRNSRTRFAKHPDWELNRRAREERGSNPSQVPATPTTDKRNRGTGKVPAGQPKPDSPDGGVSDQGAK